MDKYKKKSLKFMGFSRDLRINENEKMRHASRLKRFSTIRPLDDESITEEKSESSRIPTKGQCKTQADSRVLLLQKWKQEKMMKKQQESKLKKPVFKVGVTKSSSSPHLGSKPLFALGTSSRLDKPSFQVSNSQLFGKKQESFVASNIKTAMKTHIPQSSASKIPGGNTNEKTHIPQSSASKIPGGNTNKKESRYEPMNTRSKVIPTARGVKSNGLKIPSSKIMVASQPESKWAKNNIHIPQSSASKIPGGNLNDKESRLQPVNTRSKVIPTLRGVKSNTQIPQSSASKIPGRKLNDKRIPVKTIPKFSKTVASQQKSNISDKPSTSESKVPKKPVDDDLDTFKCDLSLIEPVEESKKSFAPKDFMFQPPAELSSSLFSVDGPATIFLRMKNQFLRTSTPKQDLSNRKSSLKSIDFEEDAKDIKKEDTNVIKNEDIRMEFQSGIKQELETFYSSSVSSLKAIDIEEDTKDVKEEDTKVIKNEGVKMEFQSATKQDVETLLSSSISSLKAIDIEEDTKDVKKEDTKGIKNECLRMEFLSGIKQELGTFLSSSVSSLKAIDIEEDTKDVKKEDTKVIKNPGVKMEFQSAIKQDVKKEDTKVIKNEGVRMEFQSLTKQDPETLLSSSLGLVSLSDLKPMDCKQSLKFENFASTQNQEVILLSSKITHPEHSLTVKPLPLVSINPHILHDSVEMDKIEINSAVINPTEVIYPPILSDLGENDKTEMNATDTCVAVDCKVALLSPEVEAVFYDDNKLPDENTKKNQTVSNGFLQNQENVPVKVPKKIRKFRPSEKPGLVSINESLENTPKSALKKALDCEITPRRSLRLAKLSGNFRSLDNLLDGPKPNDQNKTGNLSPRRSVRLSKFSTDFSSPENLFDVRRPTLFGTPEENTRETKLWVKGTQMTYDFDRLSSEMEEEARPRSTRYGKPSLLPISRASITRQSIKGDLMSFSPNV